MDVMDCTASLPRNGVVVRQSLDESCIGLKRISC